jgi:hypothetical protein
MAEYFNIEDTATGNHGLVSFNSAGNDKINYP